MHEGQNADMKLRFQRCVWVRLCHLVVASLYG
jgi:hypothetical protein